MTADDRPIAFRPMTRDDLPLMSTWLADAGVFRWWHEDPDAERVAREYGPSIDGDDPTELWLALDDDRPVGFLQCFRFGDEQEYIDELEPLVGAIEPSAASIDYLIGSGGNRGRGLGTRMITTFVEDLFARAPDVPYVLVPVHAENRASWRTLERAGFEVVARGELEPDNPSDSRDHLVLRRDRRH